MSLDHVVNINGLKMTRAIDILITVKKIAESLNSESVGQKDWWKKKINLSSLNLINKTFLH